MRRLIAVAIVSLALATSGLAVPPMVKSAILLLPHVCSIKDVSNATVEFRWDEDAPLHLDIWEGGGKMSTLGALTVFEENGKEVPTFYPMSMPRGPTGRKEIKKGEVLRIGLYLMGDVQISHPGRYYAIAKFSDAFCGAANVQFTTKKRWFEIVQTEPTKA